MPDDEAFVKDYAAKYHNIVYHGILPYEEYLQLLHRITFVLSTRNANSPENRCNFPSKIIEALLHNRAVISTIHYPQLQGINYFEIPSEVDFFRERFMRIVQMDDRELAGFINQGELIYNRFNAKVWKDKMEGIENQ